MKKKEFKKEIEKEIQKGDHSLKVLREVSKLIQKTQADLEVEFEKSAVADVLEDIWIRHNFHTLFTIASLDLFTTIKLLHDAKIDWERNFILKNGYLTIYETVLAFEKRKMKLRNLIIKEGCDLEAFNKLCTQFKSFKKEHDYELIKKIRNKTAGHIDEDFDAYYDTINQIDFNRGLLALESILNILTELLSYLFYLRNEINKNVATRTSNIQKEINEMISKLENNR